MNGFGRGHVKGILGPHGEGFRAELLSRGYTWGSAAHQVHLMAHFSRWLGAHGLSLPVMSIVPSLPRSSRHDGPRVTCITSRVAR